MSYECPKSFHEIVNKLRKNYSNLSPREIDIIEWLSQKGTFDKITIIKIKK